MAYRIFWTPIAVQDLRDICDFISRDNLVAAQTYTGRCWKAWEYCRWVEEGAN